MVYVHMWTINFSLVVLYYIYAIRENFFNSSFCEKYYELIIVLKHF